MKFSAFTLLVGIILFFALGCGGGGGGGGTTTPTTVTVSGSILWIETLNPTNPASTVAIGGKSTTTDLGSGFFSVEVPAGQTQATVTFVPGGGSPVVSTFTFPAATRDVDLGDLYIGPSSVTVHGRLVSSADASPIAGGTVSFAGRTAISASDGSFNLTNVAYPTSNFAGFLSLSGTAAATNFFNQSFQPSGTATSGVVNIGDVALVASGTDSPPALPANLVVSVQPIASSGGTLVSVKQGGVVVTSGTVGGDGRVQFWLPIGAYTLTATKGALSGTQSANITTLTSSTNATITIN